MKALEQRKTALRPNDPAQHLAVRHLAQQFATQVGSTCAAVRAAMCAGDWRAGRSLPALGRAGRLGPSLPHHGCCARRRARRDARQDRGYEAAQLRVFQDMHRQGLIFRRKKPVHWLSHGASPPRDCSPGRRRRAQRWLRPSWSMPTT